MKKNRSFHVSIRILGKLWMPWVNAAKYETIKLGKGPFERDLRSKDDLEFFILTNLAGDFSEVTDWEADLRVETPTTHGSMSRFFGIKKWANEENEFAYSDCFSQEEE